MANKFRKPKQEIKSLVDAIDVAFNAVEDIQMNIEYIDTGVGIIEYSTPDNIWNQQIMEDLEALIKQFGSYKTMLILQKTREKFIC